MSGQGVPSSVDEDSEGAVSWSAVTAATAAEAAEILAVVVGTAVAAEEEVDLPPCGVPVAPRREEVRLKERALSMGVEGAFVLTGVAEVAT